ncbi:MAG: RNA 2',3'-cyclic phosphodiesterase [Actinobacteria bacterium]|jgi:2'-5' RNA ligase|nr:MAG: RNA 2',3'-cyclic phosphodiesterase [Actinomycetota bacterium]
MPREDSGTVKARLFVALMLPRVVVEQVDLALDPVRTGSAELRWQSPDRWHITLAFLGDRDVDSELARFPAAFPAHSEPIRVEGSGHFGPVLWLGVTSPRWLIELAAGIQHVMRGDRRRFRGHVTVARSRTRGGDRELSAAVAALGRFASDAWTPDEVVLVRSVIGPKPEYEVIVRSPLTVVGP